MQRSLRTALAVGAVYFALVACVHQVQLKVPGLYVYYDVPSYDYQDMIISGLSFGWSMMFIIAITMVRRGMVREIGFVLLGGTGAVVSLARVNASRELVELVGEATGPYRIGVAALVVYLAILIALWALALRQETKTRTR